MSVNQQTQYQGGILAVRALQSEVPGKPDLPQTLQIKLHLENLDKELSFHNEQINILSERMTPVLSLDSPQDNRAYEKEGEPTCPIAHDLYKLTLSVQRLNSVINSLIRRLEV